MFWTSKVIACHFMFPVNVRIWGCWRVLTITSKHLHWSIDLLSSGGRCCFVYSSRGQNNGENTVILLLSITVFILSAANIWSQSRLFINRMARWQAPGAQTLPKRPGKKRKRIKIPIHFHPIPLLCIWLRRCQTLGPGLQRGLGTCHWYIIVNHVCWWDGDTCTHFPLSNTLSLSLSLSLSVSLSLSYPSPSLVVDLFKVLHCLPKAQGTFMLQSSLQIAQPTWKFWDFTICVL